MIAIPRSLASFFQKDPTAATIATNPKPSYPASAPKKRIPRAAIRNRHHAAFLCQRLSFAHGKILVMSGVDGIQDPQGEYVRLVSGEFLSSRHLNHALRSDPRNKDMPARHLPEKHRPTALQPNPTMGSEAAEAHHA